MSDGRRRPSCNQQARQCEERQAISHGTSERYKSRPTSQSRFRRSHQNDQERKRRAGTLNSLGLRSFALAVEDWLRNGEAYRNKWQVLREQASSELQTIAGLSIHGRSASGELPALMNTLNFHVEGCLEESLLLALDL